MTVSRDSGPRPSASSSPAGGPEIDGLLDAPMRLQKYLSVCGVASRRNAERYYIALGRVAVNGQVVTEMGCTVDPRCDVVTVDGKDALPAEECVYVMLNKPTGYVTTMHDERDRPIAASLIPDHGHVRLFPVGRLDSETTGLLLFTGDGRLSYRLLAPRYHVPKCYIATVEGKVFEQDADVLRQGVTYKGVEYLPAEVEILHAGPLSTVSCTVYEGKNHEVRKMFNAIRHPVRQLQRISLGPIELGDLPLGESRDLTDSEVCALKQAVDWC